MAWLIFPAKVVETLPPLTSSPCVAAPESVPVPRASEPVIPTRLTLLVPPSESVETRPVLRGDRAGRQDEPWPVASTVALLTVSVPKLVPVSARRRPPVLTMLMPAISVLVAPRVTVKPAAAGDRRIGAGVGEVEAGDVEVGAGADQMLAGLQTHWPSAVALARRYSRWRRDIAPC